MLNYDTDPHLNILNVADKCNIPILRLEGNRYVTKCPFCGDDTGHMYLTPIAQDNSKYNNVYRCVKCGARGSAIDLYSKLHNTTHKESFKELMEFVVKKSVEKKIETMAKPDLSVNNIADIDIRDKAYNILLSQLKLSKENYSNLISRGLEYEQIKVNGYRTLPKDYELKRLICKYIISKGVTLNGIPGFYTDKKDNWTFWTPKQGGFLIPVRDINGKIQACQIRMNEKIGKNRYVWFSSSRMKNGTRTSGFIHVHWNKEHTSESLLVTEGSLKSTIASTFKNITAVAVPGVAAYKGLADILNILKPKIVYIAYDMDYLTTIEVKKALDGLKKYLDDNKFLYYQCTWDKKYKGIDDYLYAQLKKKEKVS